MTTPAKPAAPRKTPATYRFSAATQAKIAELAAAWGGISPTTNTAVIVEAVDRAHAAEFTKPGPKRKGEGRP